MLTYSHVQVSDFSLRTWHKELSANEVELLGITPLEAYLNWASSIGWKLVAMSQYRAPALGGLPPIQWVLILSSDRPPSFFSRPYPNDDFRPKGEYQ